MTTALEKLDAKVTDARKQLDKATGKRDDAIKALIKATDQIKIGQRTLARLEKQKVEARAAQRIEKRSAAKRDAEDGPMPATM